MAVSQEIGIKDGSDTRLADDELQRVEASGLTDIRTQRATFRTRLIWGGRMAVTMAVVDMIAVAISFAAALLVADILRELFGADVVPVRIFLYHRLNELVLLSMLVIGVFAFGGLYRRNIWELDEIRRIIAGICLVAMFDATLQFILGDHSSRAWFMAAYPIMAVTVISFRMAFRSIPAVRHALTSHLVLLGNGVASDLLVDQLRESRSTPVNLLESLPLSDLEGRHPKVLGRMLDRLARHAGIPNHRLLTVLAPSQEELPRTQTAIKMLNAAGRPFTIVLPFDGLARRGLTLQKTVGADMVLVEMQPTRQSLLAQIMKRLFDLVLTGIGVVLISPALLVIACVLVFEGGPVLFSQLRVGRGDRRFRCYKFRTMRPDAEQKLHELLESDAVARTEWETFQKLSDDPRITRFGRFLRRTSLDELPQLFNVIKGDMSLVGPRPIIAPEVPGYHGDKSYYDSPDIEYYLRCTPGITGLWQVAGRASTTHDERKRLDRWYARNWSPWLDLVILFKTVRVVLGREGSR